MNYTIIGLGIIVVAIFAAMPPRYKALLSIIVMTDGFNMLPSLIAGWITWDYGAAMMLLTGAQVFLMKRQDPSGTRYPIFVVILLLFWLWLFVPLLWSILIYQYPTYGTLKYSRHMIVGYLTFFILLRLYQVDSEALIKMLRGLYFITFGLLLVSVIQFALHKEILFGLYRPYANVTRYLPIMLGFCLLHGWYFLVRALTAQRLKTHQIIYGMLAAAVLIMTFTRGLYLAAVAATAYGILLLLFDKRLSGRGSIVTLAAVVTLLAIAGVTGGLDLATARFKSGIDLVAAAPINKFGYDADTFSGRLRMAQERIEMSVNLNPIVGYGFLNEDDVTQKLRNSLHYGSIIYSPELVRAYRYGHPYVLALHSADISWGDLVLNCGLVGLLLFSLVISTMLGNYFVRPVGPISGARDWRTAFMLAALYVLLITLNSNSVVVNVQIFAFMLAGYAHTSASVPRVRRALNFTENAALLSGVAR